MMAYQVSAPKIFSAVADFIAWVLHRHRITHQMHYLDDFLFLGAPHSDEAARALGIQDVPYTVSMHKTEGPTTSLIFLGIVNDFEL